MEDVLFSDNNFCQNVGDNNEEADYMNEETFGLCEDYSGSNGDWEKQHVEVSKLIEDDVKRLRSNHSENANSSVCLDLLFEGSEEHHSSLSDAEEEIIENTISSLGLDDDVHYQVKTKTPTKNIAFEESHASWTSPTRSNGQHSDSLQELISPGGVWASPTRDNDIMWASPSTDPGEVWKSPTEEVNNLWISPDVWVSTSGEKLLLDDVVSKMSITNCNENVTNKIILESDCTESNVSSISTPSASTPISIFDFPASTCVMPSAIRVEDLEKELIRDRPTTPQPTIIKRNSISVPNTVDTKMPFPILNQKELLMKSVLPGSQHSFQDMSGISLGMYNQQLKAEAVNHQHVPCQPLLQPYYLNPAVFGCSDLYKQQIQYQKNSRYRNQHNERNNYPKDHRQKHDWYKDLNPERFKEIDYEEFIQMGPSKMMNVKEKKWIFKIGLMSLLGGDPNTSDYYFISLITKSDINQSESKSSDKHIIRKLEKTNQLVNYAQQQQQTKESHKPVKFKGSLGKLSITSVHHPRQIMDFSTPESEMKHFAPSEDNAKKKFMLYGAVERMYSVLLSAKDIERELKESKEQDELRNCYHEKINILFHMLKIPKWNFHDQNDPAYLCNIMSIPKGRKLFLRVFLLFSQEQTELLFIALVNILPFLLKKDKEQSMSQFHEKLELMLRKSIKTYKLKCIKLIRKIDLITLLVNSTSIMILITLLTSLKEKNPILEWSYYVEEIPKTLDVIPNDILLQVKPQLYRLMAMLGINRNVNG